MGPKDEEGQLDPWNTDSNDIAERKKERWYQPRTSQKRLIVLGVLIAVLVVAAVVVVVVVITQNNKNDKRRNKLSVSHGYGDHKNLPMHPTCKSGEKKETCGPYTLPRGINMSDLSPTVISRQLTCPLEGDCWTGEQCYECFKLETWKVGNINYIPVCCPQCLISGLKASNNRCECRALNKNS